MVVMGPLRHERAMLEDAQGEGLERQGRQGGVEWTNEVFVEPLCFFYLEANALY